MKCKFPFTILQAKIKFKKILAKVKRRRKQARFYGMFAQINIQNVEFSSTFYPSNTITYSFSIIDGSKMRVIQIEKIVKDGLGVCCLDDLKKPKKIRGVMT